ncbi:erythromycin esterase family protein [Flavobacterium jejuense]|uniref:Erythromycin esterase family protein n=1 Tax=Flavobacterium jejuense TaxID=1544455 RepID=A0ABX0IPQ6_9FLAO|nr:erythromycin esterase family protein [Flavobacterium jejuense]NHN25060.1 erythromycin esterase family protein [Flavobacterium jejuense]
MKTFLKLLLFSLFVNGNLIAQETSDEKYNLDFEILKEKGFKDWSLFGNDSYVILQDSLNQYNGRYSAIIEYKEGKEGFKALSFNIPASYSGKKIKLTGFVKTENVADGYAGLWLRIDPEVGFDNMNNRGIVGTTDWKKYEIELDYNSLVAEKILIGGLLVGKGKMWIDDLTLTIDDKDFKILPKEEKKPVSQETLKKTTNKIVKNMSDISFATDKKLDRSLDKLIKDIGDSKIVSIGEDTHGTSEFYKLREAITKKLIDEKGFNLVILENPYDDIELLTQSLKKEEISSLMKKHLFSIYQTKEMLSFLNWFKSKKDIKFKGCDDSYWVLSSLLKDEILNLNNDSINKLFNCIEEKIVLSVDDYLNKYPNALILPKNNYGLGASIYEDLMKLENILNKENILNDKLKELIFNAKTSYVNFLNMTKNKEIQSRDEVMAKRISYLAKDPNAKIIIWAHNAHISNKIIIGNEIGIMGRDLKNEFKENYYSIGLSSLKGTHSYIENKFINGDHDFSEKLLLNTIKNQPKTSWELIFNELNKKPYYFNTKNLQKEEVIENLKLVGYGKESDLDYYKLNPFVMFDTIFFIETTNGTSPLD